MLDEYLDWAQSRGQALFYAVCLIGGSILLTFSFWLWWHYQYLNPQNVFWSAVNNNLIISGVTKQTEGIVQEGTINQIEQISLGAQNVVKSLSTTTQDLPKNAVVKETIGTSSANFTRYTKIEVDQKTLAGGNLDFSAVINQWSKSDVNQDNSGALTTSLFFVDPIPLARLNGQQRTQTIDQMKQDDFYNIDFNKVAKERKNGRLYYVYDASVSPGRYMALVKQLDSYMGLNQLTDLDPNQQSGAPLEFKVSIDAVSHQISTISYVGGNQNTSYSAWGAIRSVAIPDKTIGLNELQDKLQQVLGGE